MYAQLERRPNHAAVDFDGGTAPLLLRPLPIFPTTIPAAVSIRRRTMKVYGGKVVEDKIVLSLRRNSMLWIVLEVVAMYASVDTVSLLPLLILTNVATTWNILCVFGIFPS
jgi:hypothetical protein